MGKVAQRWEFAMNVLWHPSHGAIQVVIFLGGISDNFKSSNYEFIRDLANLIPPIPWFVWVILSLVALLVAVFEYSFREYDKFQKLLRPKLKVTGLQFERSVNDFYPTTPEITYDLFLACSNPLESSRSIRSVKAPIIQTDEVLAKLKSKKRWLRFEDDMFHPEVELNPGEDRKLRIASFYRKYGWKMVVEVINLDGERIAFNDLEIPDAQKLTFRLSADDMQAQEWEICFGKNGNELWAKGTKVYPISNGPPYTDKITLEGS